MEVSDMLDRQGWIDVAPHTFATNLRRLMVGSTQQELADQVGISRSGLNKILQGEVDPRLSTVQALAEAIGKPIGSLTGEAEREEGLTLRAQEIARMYDALDPDEQAFVWRLFRKIGGTTPSSE